MVPKENRNVDVDGIRDFSCAPIVAAFTYRLLLPDRQQQSAPGFFGSVSCAASSLGKIHHLPPRPHHVATTVALAEHPNTALLWLT